MDVRAGDAEEHGRLKARAGLALILEPHHRLLEALAGGKGEEAALDEALDGGTGADVAVVKEKFHAPRR